MAPSNEQLVKMINQAQTVINKMQEQLAGGELSEEEQAEALQTIEDMLQKIERLANKQTV